MLKFKIVLPALYFIILLVLPMTTSDKVTFFKPPGCLAEVLPWYTPDVCNGLYLMVINILIYFCFGLILDLFIDMFKKG